MSPVEEGAVVRDSIVHAGTVIKSGAVVQYAIVAENAVIEEGAVVGERPEAMENIEDWGVAVVGSGRVRAQRRACRAKAMVDEDVKGA